MLIKVIYLVLASLMFYFVQGAISAGGFGFMYRYLFGMAIIGLAVASFIVKPNMDRAKRLGKGVLIMSTPYAVTVLWSAVIWIAEFAPLRTMTRGFFFPFYQTIAAMTAAATLYLFGKKGIWYNLLAMCLGNTVIVILAIQDGGGVGAFIQELIALLTSFGEVTGYIMHAMEVHDLTFSFGPYAVMLALWIQPKNKIWWIATIAVLFYMTVGLKRIEIGAIAIAVIICWGLKLMKDRKSVV